MDVIKKNGKNYKAELKNQFAAKIQQQLRSGTWKTTLGALSRKPSLMATSYPGRMFSLQQSLPRLPVPPLQQTLDKYLTAIEPLLSKEDYKHAQELISNFAKTDGPKLQALLEARAKQHVNWLADWWVNVAYLEYRLPCPIHVNPGIMFPIQKFDGGESQLRYAAKMVSGILDYKSMIDERSLPVEIFGGHPQCMVQFYKILSSCRIPGKKRDSFVNFPPDSENAPRHIVVVHNNHFFKLDVYGSNRKPLSAKQLCEQLQKIVSASQTPAPPVGILTSDNRNTWAKVYEKLLKAGNVNKETLEAIQQGIFMLCLDQPMTFDKATPTDRLSLIAGQMNHGWGSKRNSGNRWFDKTIQFIVGSDGAVGLNYEHAPAEGPPIISVVDHTLNYVQHDHSQESAPGVTDPVALPFSLTPEIESAIEESKEAFDSTISDLDMFSYCFDAFGKNFIKGQRLSPDGFIQCAFQLAYFRMYGKHVATYESGSLRRFQLGRTDTIRSCTNEASAYCRAMKDDKKPVGEKAQLLRKAVQAHREYSSAVVAGQGVDRHLLGLKLIAVENGMNVPELFMDPIYDQSVHFGLSTSQVPSKFNAVLCFGPVVPDGYGVCYNPMPENINFVVSAWNSSPETVTKTLANEIRRALMDGHNLLLQTQQAKL